MHSSHEQNLRKWLFSAMATALICLLSPLFSVPLGPIRAFPLQHMANILLAVSMGTKYAASSAFACALLRNMLGTGSLLAFPGSVFGAAFSGFLYARTGSLLMAAVGEFIGTSFVGGLISYPLARLFLGSEQGAFFYVILFAASCGIGCILALVLLKSFSFLRNLFLNQK